MIIELVGSPHSGKSTLAAKIFETLKSSSVVAEFLAEEARHYIVDVRKGRSLPYTVNPKLSDEDQLKILERQFELELKFKKYTSPHTIIVTDSSPLNSLLYMSDNFKFSEAVLQKIESWQSQIKPVIFYCKPVDSTFHNDSNRIHDKDESLKIDTRIPTLLELYAKNLNVTEIYGTKSGRFDLAYGKVIELYARGML
jgi:predicted ATPase